MGVLDVVKGRRSVLRLLDWQFSTLESHGKYSLKY